MNDFSVRFGLAVSSAARAFAASKGRHIIYRRHVTYFAARQHIDHRNAKMITHFRIRKPKMIEISMQ